MRSAILPAVLMFGACAAGLLFVREQMAPVVEAPATVAIAETVSAPAPVVQLGPKQAVLRKERDGHYWARPM